MTSKLPSAITITPSSGKFAPDELKEFNVKFENPYSMSVN